ncbi:hypothetical protein IAT38_002564 [Cryptococcus sp. DSM 104549]
MDASFDKEMAKMMRKMARCPKKYPAQQAELSTIRSYLDLPPSRGKVVPDYYRDSPVMREYRKQEDALRLRKERQKQLRDHRSAPPDASNGKSPVGDLDSSCSPSLTARPTKALPGVDVRQKLLPATVQTAPEQPGSVDASGSRSAPLPSLLLPEVVFPHPSTISHTSTPSSSSTHHAAGATTLLTPLPHDPPSVYSPPSGDAGSSAAPATAGSSQVQDPSAVRSQQEPGSETDDATAAAVRFIQGQVNGNRRLPKINILELKELMDRHKSEVLEFALQKNLRPDSVLDYAYKIRKEKRAPNEWNAFQGSELERKMAAAKGIDLSCAQSSRADLSKKLYDEAIEVYGRGKLKDVILKASMEGSTTMSSEATPQGTAAEGSGTEGTRAAEAGRDSVLGAIFPTSAAVRATAMRAAKQQFQDTLDDLGERYQVAGIITMASIHLGEDNEDTWAANELGRIYLRAKVADDMRTINKTVGVVLRGDAARGKLQAKTSNKPSTEATQLHEELKALKLSLFDTARRRAAIAHGLPVPRSKPAKCRWATGPLKEIGLKLTVAPNCGVELDDLTKEGSRGAKHNRKIMKALKDGDVKWEVLPVAAEAEVGLESQREEAQRSPHALPGGASSVGGSGPSEKEISGSARPETTERGNGYRYIDCAWAYRNEKEVGEGIKDSGVPRGEIWVTSKLLQLHHHPEHVELAVRDTLKNLGIEYLDLYLMHWNINFQVESPKGVLPTRENSVKAENGKIKVDVELSNDVSPTWRAMEKLVEKGLVKSIGVSNFNIQRAEKLLEQAKIMPVTNQIELSIQCPQPELVSSLLHKNILPQGYSPLGGTGQSHLRENAVVQNLADKRGVQTANILLSWLVKRGVTPLPKSVTPESITNNLKLVDLSPEEFEEIEQLAKSHPVNRVCDLSDSYEPDYDIYQENDPELSDKAQFAKLGLKL